MGNVGSSSKNEQFLLDEMATYKGKWDSRTPYATQTELFRKIVPMGIVDFDEQFRENHLSGIFTSEKVQLPIVYGDFNCLHLFRDSQEETKIPIYSDNNYTVLHPMGNPGRDLGENHASKISHMMVIRHSTDGPITFNEMLPSTPEEMQDLEERLKVMEVAMNMLKDNVSIDLCGPKVMHRAKNGWNGTPLCGEGVNVEEMTIREYLLKAIVQMPDNLREDVQPGYKLFNKENEEIGKDEGSVRALIDEVFNNASLKTRTYIQAPDCLSQLLSHIHGFLLEGDIPESMEETYRDCNMILKLKKEHMYLDQSDEEEEVDEGSTLTRQSTVSVGGGQ